MRRVVVSNIASVDGFYAASDGKTLVGSDSFVVAADNAWRDTTTVIPGDELPGWIAASKKRG
jgi:hypothetical protein